MALLRIAIAWCGCKRPHLRPDVRDCEGIVLCWHVGLDTNSRLISTSSFVTPIVFLDSCRTTGYTRSSRSARHYTIEAGISSPAYATVVYPPQETTKAHVNSNRGWGASLDLQFAKGQERIALICSLSLPPSRAYPQAQIHPRFSLPNSPNTSTFGPQEPGSVAMQVQIRHRRVYHPFRWL